MFLDHLGRCRWSTSTGEPLLFVKYDGYRLNVLDVEKKLLIFKESVQLSPRGLKETMFISSSFSSSLHNTELIPSNLKGK